MIRPYGCHVPSQDPRTAISADDVAGLVAVALARAGSMATVQKALIIANKLDTAIVADAITQSRGVVTRQALSPRAPTLTLGPPSPQPTQHTPSAAAPVERLPTQDQVTACVAVVGLRLE